MRVGAVPPPCECRDKSRPVTRVKSLLILKVTGLTFGTISALFGLNNHVIDQTQYTILVTVVILSAVVPALIAQAWFCPELELTTKRRSMRRWSQSASRIGTMGLRPSTGWPVIASDIPTCVPKLPPLRRYDHEHRRHWWAGPHLYRRTGQGSRSLSAALGNDS